MDYGLTAAEEDVAQMICKGMRDKEIAIARGSEVPTVKTQVTALLKKLGVRRSAVASVFKAPRRSRIAAGIEAGGPHKGRKARETQRAK